MPPFLLHYYLMLHLVTPALNYYFGFALSSILCQ